VFSADIVVPEREREVRFYSRVLSTGEDSLWRDDLMNNLGTPITDLGARSAAHAHLPIQWMPHIQVTDVAAGAQRGLDLGGSVLMPGYGVDRQIPGGSFSSSLRALNPRQYCKVRSDAL
jgi:predicted enzyme related to lactoylglutathione lyase